MSHPCWQRRKNDPASMAESTSGFVSKGRGWPPKPAMCYLCLVVHFSRIAFSDLGNQITSFEDYLRDNDIHLHPASVLAQSIGLSRIVLEAHQTKSIPDSLDSHAGTSALANVTYLSRSILTARNTQFEQELLPRLRDLTSGDPSPLVPGPRSQERDLSFEVLCGCICAQFAARIRFTEPDIQCDLEEKTWAIACKVAYGQPPTIAKAITTGLDQIAKSQRSEGLVLVQVTNIFPHEMMYWRDPTDGQILSVHESEAQHKLLETHLRKTIKPIEHVLNKRMKLRQPRKVPAVGVFFVVQTLTYFRRLRTMMAGCYFVPLRTDWQDSGAGFLTRFNEGIQKL